MKNIFFFFLMLVSIAGYNQEDPKYSIEIGVTASTFSGTETSINKIGILSGISYTWFNNPSFGGEVGLQFIQKGAFNPPDRETGNNSFYKLTGNYLQVPFSVLYYKKGITYMLGLSGGYLISHKEENESGVFPVSEPFRKYEVSIIGGGKINLTDNLRFKAAINQSLIPVKLYPSGFVTRWYNRGHYNTTLLLGVSYQI